MWKARSRYRQLVCAREECHECCLLRRISLVVICFFPARCIFALYVDCLESFPRHCWLFVPITYCTKTREPHYRRKSSISLPALFVPIADAGRPRALRGFMPVRPDRRRFLSVLVHRLAVPVPTSPFLTLESSNGESRIIRTLVAGWCLNVMDRQVARKLSPRRRTSAQASDKDLPMRT